MYLEIKEKVFFLQNSVSERYDGFDQRLMTRVGRRVESVGLIDSDTRAHLKIRELKIFLTRQDLVGN